MIDQQKNKRERRHKKIRAKIIGTEKTPRLMVFRSNKHIYAQLIDDRKGQTMASATDVKAKGKKTEKAVAVGKEIAQKALTLKIDKVVFDRSGYKYHGRVKALSLGAREGGLKF